MHWPPLCLMVTALWSLGVEPEKRTADGQRLQSETTPTGRDMNEYCELDVFRPRCDSDEVILVTEAKYGMVKLGRCVQTDYGYVGCYADVLDYLNAKCAGRRYCEQRQPDQFLSDVLVSRASCPKEFKAFLYADYRCVKDEKRACKSCSKSRHARLTAPSGYISSIVTAETQEDGSCGSSRCPWVISALPGQIINVTLLDYNHTQSRSKGAGGGSSSTDTCLRYAIVKERANPKDMPLCAGGKRESSFYTSVSNTVEIQIVSQEAFTWKNQFLIRYEALGCPDIVPPKSGSVKRVDDSVEVECQLTGDIWKLTCIDNRWEGQMGTCGSDQPPVGAVGLLKKTASSFLASVPFGVLMAAVVAIAIIIGVLIMTVGVVCFKKQQYKRRYRNSASVPQSQYIDFGDDATVCEAALLQKGSVPTLIFKPGDPAAGGRENKYANNSRKMDARPLPSIPDLRSGSWKMVAGDPAAIAALQRINSGRGGGQTRMLIRSCGPDGLSRSGPRPGSTCTVYSQTDPHQYFVLEPEEPTGTGRDIREMILLHERQTIPRALFHARGGGGDGGVVQAPDNDLMTTSIHEIPMRSPFPVSPADTGGVTTGPAVSIRAA